MSIKNAIQVIEKNFRLGIQYFHENGAKNSLKRVNEEIFRKKARIYENWIEINENYSLSEVKQSIETFKVLPKISIILPVYNTELEYLKTCINSVLDQYYTNWELCIVDDHSSKEYIKRILTQYEQEDSRIKVVYRQENGHISKASNSGLEIASGEYIGLLDHDDTLAPHALYKVVAFINEKPRSEFIYSDEDKINESGKRCKPFFKPDWSPDTILSQNYICHFVVVKKSLIEKAGGFRIGYEGSQDYDLFLRCTELSNEIIHIPEILYHWRMTENSTAVKPESKEYAFEAGKKALQSALERRQIEGIVSKEGNLGIYHIDYKISENPMVSIIIPTKDHGDDLTICIDSIIEKTKYNNYEIIVVDNGSEKQDTFKVFEKYKRILQEKFRVLKLDIPFNFSKLINEGVKFAKGEYVLLLNNDIEIITNGWLEKMLGFAQQKHVGAVGTKLYYKDGTIQHAGVVIGVGGVAGHSHKYYGAGNAGYFKRLKIDSNYAAVTGACLMVEKKKYLTVGGLDEENLMVSFNDVDFCLKLLEVGYYNLCTSQVECYHYESKSRGTENTRKKQKRFKKEVIYMQKKWGKYIEKDPYYSPHLTLEKEDFGIKV